MNDSTVWFVAAAILIGAEMLSGTFYLLAIAAGLLVGALLAWLELALATQLIAASLASLLAVGLLRQWKRQHLPVVNTTNQLDIGQRVDVDSWLDDRHVRVRYRGTLWNGELARSETPHATSYFIIAQHGNTLILDIH